MTKVQAVSPNNKLWQELSQSINELHVLWHEKYILYKKQAGKIDNVKAKKKKICPVQVTQPTLKFYPLP